MILRSIADGLSQRKWGTVATEVLIVVVGIFIGLQVDDWNQARRCILLKPGQHIVPGESWHLQIQDYHVRQSFCACSIGTQKNFQGLYAVDRNLNLGIDTRFPERSEHEKLVVLVVLHEEDQ